MELVYLWVEEYKNIKNQGFNFSPKFTCKYENGELTIEEKKDYVSIFPENINVTAIVGENGSGKSGILEYLIRNLYCIILDKNSSVTGFASIIIFLDTEDNELKFLSTIKSDLIINNLTSIKPSKFTLNKRWLSPQVKNDGSVKVEENPNFDISYLKKIIKNLKENSFILHYDYSLSIFYKDDKNSNKIFRETNIQELYDNTLDFLVCVPNKLDYKNIVKVEKFNIINHCIKPINIKNTTYFQPNHIRIEAKLIKKVNKDISIEDVLKLIIDNHEHEAEYLKKLSGYNEELENIFKLNPPPQTLVDNKGNEIGCNYFFEVNIEKINKNNINLITELPSKYFDIHVLDQDTAFSRTYEELSNGEKTALNVRLYIESYIQKYPNRKNYLILLDEPSNDMHPLWQKNLLDYLIKTFEGRKEKFHLIITSHSPFLLSDIPQKNVIFLEKNKDDKCKNVTNETNIETFGANIHTLLSHGFFMKDGLMGEFAKEKINKAIEYLNQKELTPDEINYCENIISIIGEPILKRQLQKMLDSKCLSQIDKIKQQIAELEQKLAEHQHAQN